MTGLRDGVFAICRRGDLRGIKRRRPLQRLRDSLFGTANFTYDHSDYEPTTRGVQTDRADDYFLLRCGLEAILGRSWSLGVFYQYREDISSDENYSFNNNQVGIQAAWGY